MNPDPYNEHNTGTPCPGCGAIIHIVWNNDDPGSPWTECGGWGEGICSEYVYSIDRDLEEWGALFVPFNPLPPPSDALCAAMENAHRSARTAFANQGQRVDVGLACLGCGMPLHCNAHENPGEITVTCGDGTDGCDCNDVVFSWLTASRARVLYTDAERLGFWQEVETGDYPMPTRDMAARIMQQQRTAHDIGARIFSN